MKTFFTIKEAADYLAETPSMVRRAADDMEVEKAGQYRIVRLDQMEELRAAITARKVRSNWKPRVVAKT